MRLFLLLRGNLYFWIRGLIDFVLEAISIINNSSRFKLFNFQRKCSAKDTTSSYVLGQFTDNVEDFSMLIKTYK